MVGRIVLAAVVATLVDCSFDPVRDEAIADLGPEAPGVAPGPLHRGGQPCLVCHDGSTASPAMSAGGTVYRVVGDATPLGGARVTLSDARGTIFAATTNAAGNFYVTPSSWQPVYPVRVAVGFGGKTATMTTIVGRDGSCASCHADPKSRISAGPVYLVSLPSLFPSGGGP